MICVDDIMTKFDNSCHEIDFDSHVFYNMMKMEMNLIIPYWFMMNLRKGINGYKMNETSIVQDIVHIEIGKYVEFVEEEEFLAKE